MDYELIGNTTDTQITKRKNSKKNAIAASEQQTELPLV